MNPIAYRNYVDPNALRAHNGHHFINIIDETNLPHQAILHCETCHQELARKPLDIRVITFASMCFGDAMEHWQNRLLVGVSNIPIEEIPGEQPLIERIDSKIMSQDARLEVSTVMMGHNARVTEPARIIEPVGSDYASEDAYQSARTEFEAMWAAVTLPDRTHLALQALTIVEQLLELHHNSHDQEICGEEEAAHRNTMQFNETLERLDALLHPELNVAPPAETLDHGPDDWLGDLPV